MNIKKLEFIMADFIKVLLLCILSSAACDPTATKPNIVFVFVDDWGHADVNFRNPAISTPNFNDLASKGVILNRHYVFKHCSPSRASFLTGRWPHHAHQYSIHLDVELGININMTLIPAKLKSAGYKTHMVGKWHEGYYHTKYLPVNRGFDTSSGYFGAGESHMTQVHGCAVDCWKNRDVDTRNGTYDSYHFKNDLTDIFNNHNTDDPLFLYLPLHNVHSPLEVPEEWLEIYPKNSTCDTRRTYQAMVSVADNVTGHVVQLLKQKGMWDSTLIVVSSDNGGANGIGSNYPLKGSKKTFFEGGVRVIAFASGGLIPEKMRGQSTDGFIHVADWYTTFCNLAGVDPADSGDGKFNVDGKDVWPIITGANSTSSHNEIVLGYNYEDTGAIISGKYKLIVGKQGTAYDRVMWSPLNYPCKDGPKGEDCDPYCLYDIVNDPGERKDLVDKEKDVLKEMLKKYNSYSKEPRHLQDQGYHNDSSLPVFKDACTFMKDNGGYWRPWKKD